MDKTAPQINADHAIEILQSIIEELREGKTVLDSNVQSRELYDGPPIEDAKGQLWANPQPTGRFSFLLRFSTPGMGLPKGAKLLSRLPPPSVVEEMVAARQLPPQTIDQIAEEIYELTEKLAELARDREDREENDY